MEVRPGYKQTEVGVIPQDWETPSIIEVAPKIIDYRGRTPRKLGMDWGGGEIAALSARNVKMGFIDFDEECNLGSEALYKRWMTNGDTERGDIVFTTEAPLGNVALIPDDQRYILSQRTILLKTDPARAYSPFLFQLMLSDGFQELLAENASGSTAQGIQRKKFETLRVACPPLPEQRAIAAALSDADAALAGLDRLIAKKRDLKQAAMQQLLTRQTRLPGFQGEWEVKRLGDLGAFLKGSGVKKDESRSGDLPCIRYGEIYTHHTDCIKSFNSWISTDVARTATRMKPGDLLFAGSGETKAEIGKCVAFVHDCEAYAGGDIVILRPVGVDSLFMGYYCNTSRINAQKAGKGQGDAVVHISAAALSSVSMTLPAPAEQTAIATVLSDMDAELTALEARRAKTRALKQAMMQELLTGRTRLV